MFPTNSERLIGFSDAFSAFVYGYPSSCPRAHCTPQQKRAYSALHPQACKHLPSAVPWISEDRLLVQGRMQTPSTGLRYPSLEESAGERCSECGL